MNLLHKWGGSLTLLLIVSCSEKEPEVTYSWEEDSEDIETNAFTSGQELSVEVDTFHNEVTTTIGSASESFEIGNSGYVDGRLVSQGPDSSGFRGQWKTKENRSFYISESGLDYPGLVTSGRSIRSSHASKEFLRNGRQLSAGYTGASSGVVYLSFLLKLDKAELGANYAAFELHDSTLGSKENGLNDEDNRQFSLGFAGRDFGTKGTGFRIGNGYDFQGVVSETRNTNVNLYVVRLDLSSNPLSDSVTVWMNPPIGGATDPTGGVTVSGFDISFDTVSLARFGVSGVHLDEVRLGKSFLEVTPTQ